jgi:branched-chain amino acid transport system permease protein
MNQRHVDRRAFAALLAAVLLAIGAFAALVSSTFLLTLAAYTAAFAVFALSVNVMLGGIGEVPLGHCLFYGVGAYGAGIAMKSLGLSFGTGMVLGAVAAAAGALVIGALTLRLTGAYFSIVSWGLAGVAVIVALNLEHITGGALGLFGFPPLHLAGLDLGQPRQYFLAASGVLVLVVLLLHAVRTSRFGAAMESVRQNPHLAASLGIDVFDQRLLAFVFSAVLASIGGALTLPFTPIVTPELLSVVVTVDALLMVLLGGTRLLVGPVLGALVFCIVPYYIEMDANVRILVFSSAIILLMMFAPGGLHQILLSTLARFRGGQRAPDARHGL